MQPRFGGRVGAPALNALERFAPNELQGSRRRQGNANRARRALRPVCALVLGARARRSRLPRLRAESMALAVMISGASPGPPELAPYCEGCAKELERPARARNTPPPKRPTASCAAKGWMARRSAGASSWSRSQTAVQVYLCSPACVGLASEGFFTRMIRARAPSERARAEAAHPPAEQLENQQLHGPPR